MGLFDRFRKKEDIEQMKETRVHKTRKTELDQICRDDKETLGALLNTMFLDPRKIEVSMEDASEKAKKLETSKDNLKAKIWYEIAGGLAIYKGEVKKVKEYYTKCEKLSPETKYPILKNPEKAVAKAKEYYKKHLKD